MNFKSYDAIVFLLTIAAMAFIAGIAAYIEERTRHGKKEPRNSSSNTNV